MRLLLGGSSQLVLLHTEISIMCGGHSLTCTQRVGAAGGTEETVNQKEV